MNTEPIRVLQVVGRMDRGGIETMIMNQYRNIDREKVQFDFLAHFGREAAYNDEIRSMGGRIYEMPALRDENRVFFWRFFSYLFALNKFFREHREYKVIHGHMTHTAALYMPIAKRYGVSCRIVHSHSTKSKAGLLGILTNFLHKFATRDATDFFACSKAAQKWFFTEEIINSGDVYFVTNAIDAKRFRYDPEKRRKMRENFDLKDDLTIAHVARFRTEKNQAFMIEVLKEALKVRDDITLIFVGDGPQEKAVRAKAKACGVDGHVRFLGLRSDVPDILQAADVFVLPSSWEGQPLTAIEAQASGLHCIVSDSLSWELDTLGMVRFISLDKVNEWVDALFEESQKPRRDTYEEIVAAGYDSCTTAAWLQEFYLSHSEELKIGE